MNRAARNESTDSSQKAGSAPSAARDDRSERDPGEQGDHQTGPRHRDLGAPLGPLVEGYREDRATEHAVQVAGLEVGQARHQHADDRDQQRRGDGPEVPARGVVRRGAEQPARERRHEDGEEDRGEDPDHQRVRRPVGAEVRVEQPAQEGAGDDAPEEDRDPSRAGRCRAGAAGLCGLVCGWVCDGTRLRPGRPPGWVERGRWRRRRGRTPAQAESGQLTVDPLVVLLVGAVEQLGGEDDQQAEEGYQQEVLRQPIPDRADRLGRRDQGSRDR